MSLESIPTAHQGKRLWFGSCTMAAALTQLNAYIRSRKVLLQEFENPPFYRLGKILPMRRAFLIKSVGEADEAVEANFNECHGRYAATAPEMARCLLQKLSERTCMDSRLRYVPCPKPRIETFEGDVAQRRRFIQKHFSQADSARILPLTFPWDTRLVLGPPQAGPGDVSLGHVSALIGRRLTSAGKCQVLIRNSWGTCSRWSEDYAYGTCDRKGVTDDVWVDAESFLARSAELTTLVDERT